MDHRRILSKPLQRRIKRHVHAREHRFAAVAAPELAPICQEELRSLSISDSVVTETGVEFTGSFDACYVANLWLRTASRILCRVHRFRAGALEELFHKVSHFPWELWIDPLTPVQIDAHVRYSRIEHEGRVKETIHKAIQRCFTTQGLPAPSQAAPPSAEDAQEPDVRQKVLVHLVENQCEISLDTTGDHLHRRGYRLHHAGAPLRETLAAAILIRAGWKDTTPLLDGMCGSGTIPIEAGFMARGIPPGLDRSFLFERWPSFSPAKWGYLRREARKGIRDGIPAPILGVDSREEAVQTARDNGRRAGLHEDIQWICQDFFDFEPSRLGRPGVLVVNPPYGKRLESAGKTLYERLGGRVRTHYRGWRLAVLAPHRSFLQQIGFSSLRVWPITHGGLPILVGMGRV